MAEPEPQTAAPDTPMPSPDNHHWKTGPEDVPVPADDQPPEVAS
jgi:hypothetical protein